MEFNGRSIIENKNYVPRPTAGLESQIAILTNENKRLQEENERAKKVIEDSEKDKEALRAYIKTHPVKKRRSNKEIELESEAHEYSPLKSNGQPKATAANAIRSYDDFKRVEDYLWNKNKRDWMLWRVGVALGVRVSDLLSLKIGYFIESKEDNPNSYRFRDRLKIYEKKTSKLNDILITDVVKETIATYFDSIGWNFNFEDYLFISSGTKGKMSEVQGWRIINGAGKAAGLPYNISSHTMRKTFANIVACVDKSTIDANSITKVQGLLNHSDPRVTMRYLGTYKTMYDKARKTVSDFVAGKLDVNILSAGETTHTIDELFDKVEELIGLNSEKRDD